MILGIPEFFGLYLVWGAPGTEVMTLEVGARKDGVASRNRRRRGSSATGVFIVLGDRGVNRTRNVCTDGRVSIFVIC